MHVLVTGGSSGIGRAITEALIEDGVTVTVLSRRRPDDWEGARPRGWNQGGHWLQGNLREAHMIERVMREWLSRNGATVDGIVHSAVSYGAGGRHRFEETSLTEWQAVHEVNARGPFLITKLMLPVLIGRQKSVILAITSEVARNPGPGRIAYASSKAAAYALFAGLAAELERTTVSVVQLRPRGLVATPGLRKRRPENFDFSGYASPMEVARSAVEVIRALGAGLHGECISV